MSGWKIDSPKYKITEALFNEIWDSLELLADVDKDGKITKTEWVRSYILNLNSKRNSFAHFIGRFHRVKRFTDLVEASTKTVKLL